MSPILSMPFKNVVSGAVLAPCSSNAIRKRKLPVNTYYLVTSQKATRDHEITSIMGLKHSKNFLSLPEVEFNSFFPRSDLTSTTTTCWLTLAMDLTSFFLKVIFSTTVLEGCRVYKDVNHFAQCQEHR